MRTITNAEIIAAAQKAWDEKSLGCLYDEGCYYVKQLPNGTTVNCAIGAVLNDEEKAEILNRALNGQGCYAIAGVAVEFEDKQFAAQFQNWHDGFRFQKALSSKVPTASATYFMQAISRTIPADEWPLRKTAP